MNPSPDSVSAAGFYYTGIYIIITFSHCITIRIIIFEVSVMEQYAFTVAEG